MAALALAACSTASRVDAPLDVFREIEGCWVGTFEGGNGLQDQRCIAPLAGGRWLDTHQVIGAGYGGDTVYAWDAASERIVVDYTANDGGRMSSHGDVVDGGIDFPDATYVGADGEIQALRSRWRFEGDRLEVATERLENGAWVAFMRITYQRTPTR